MTWKSDHHTVPGPASPPGAEADLLRAREALRARERELSLIFDSVSDVIFFLSVEEGGNYRFVSVNRSFLTATGLSEKQVVGKSVRDVIPEPSLSLVLRNYETACRERRTVKWEETTDYPAGRKTGEVSVTPIFDAGGACKNLIGTVHDVTERKQGEEYRATLAALVESSDDAIITKSLDGVIMTWNDGARRLFGHTAAEAVGQPVTMLIPPGREDEEPAILERLRRGERVDHYDTVRVTKDGSPVDVSLTVSPIKDAAGRIVGASKIARDVTERKRAEAALRDETRVLELLNNTGTAIASQLELPALLQSVTDAATQLAGAQFGAFFYNAVDEQGESYLLYTLSGASRAAFETFDHPRPTDLFAPTFRGEGPVRCDDVLEDPRYGRWAPHYGMPEGHLPVRSYLAVSVVSRNGDVIGGLFFGHAEPGVFTERTERLIAGVAAQAGVAIDNARLFDEARRAAVEREGLLAAERAARAEAERLGVLKDEFLATLSHELRTPLNAILGWSQILRTEAPTEEMREGLSVIERNTRVQAQLIDDLLDMSRIISGKLRLDVQRVELQDVIKAAIASVRQSADAKEIRLQVVLDPLAGPVRGDANRLQQCFWNLLSNAIKFTPRGGRVQVSLARVNSHVEVRVEDNGQGIKPEFLPYVFERFRQADASTTRTHGGLGLGLSIVKSLVELHGGSVRAKSAGEGLGATLCVELPLMVVNASDAEATLPDDPSGVPARATAYDLPSLDGLTVLAVDDEADARNLIRRLLEDCGARVLLASSSSEGVELVRRQRPDMILSDIGMPGEDGYEFIRKVRLLPPDKGGRTPAAALTAFARSEDRTRALLAGYQTHVAKPVEPAELTAVVASLATRR